MPNSSKGLERGYYRQTQAFIKISVIEKRKLKEEDVVFAVYPDEKNGDGACIEKPNPFCNPVLIRRQVKVNLFGVGFFLPALRSFGPGTVLVQRHY